MGIWKEIFYFTEIGFRGEVANKLFNILLIDEMYVSPRTINGEPLYIMSCGGTETRLTQESYEEIYEFLLNYGNNNNK